MSTQHNVWIKPHPMHGQDSSSQKNWSNGINYMTSMSYSDTNFLPENEATIVKQQKITSHKADDLYSVFSL